MLETCYYLFVKCYYGEMCIVKLYVRLRLCICDWTHSSVLVEHIRVYTYVDKL